MASNQARGYLAKGLVWRQPVEHFQRLVADMLGMANGGWGRPLHGRRPARRGHCWACPTVLGQPCVADGYPGAATSSQSVAEGLKEQKGLVGAGYEKKTEKKMCMTEKM